MIIVFLFTLKALNKIRYLNFHNIPCTLLNFMPVNVKALYEFSTKFNFIVTFQKKICDK